jgi:hypothetical protein
VIVLLPVLVWAASGSGDGTPTTPTPVAAASVVPTASPTAVAATATSSTRVPQPSPTHSGPVEPATATAFIEDGRIALGAWIYGIPWDAAALNDFTALVGIAPKIVHVFQLWGADDPADAAFDAPTMDLIAATDAMPLVSWEPQRAGPVNVNDAEYALRTIVGGEHDAYIRQWASDAAAWGRPFYLRWAHEMNGDWAPWCVGVNGNTSAEFVEAWQHIYAIFQEEGADNVRWIWSPNILYGTTTYAEVYPGDAYVDWLSLTGYNWGTSQPTTTWQSLTAVFAESYDVITQIADKPLMISETASSELGGDKAGWIVQGLLTDMPLRFPRVQAVVWFNEDKLDQTDWRVNSSAASLDAYRAVAASDLYQGRLP